MTNISATSRACSPVSGCESSNSSTFTPSFSAYCGSKACSASINAHVPPSFWHCAIIWRVNVVLPEDSGPYISVTLPLGIPPMPNAMSSPRDPVDIDGISRFSRSPILITVPLPK